MNGAYCSFLPWGLSSHRERSDSTPQKPISLYNHRVWQTADGLPQNSVNSVVEDSNGYLWLGTEEGLARLDGVAFTLYDKGNTAALRNNSILILLNDSKGNLWVGTRGGLTQMRSGNSPPLMPSRARWSCLFSRIVRELSE